MKSKHESDEKEWQGQLDEVKRQNQRQNDEIIKLGEQILKLKEENLAIRAAQAAEIQKAEERVRKEVTEQLSQIRVLEAKPIKQELQSSPYVNHTVINLY